MVAYASLFIAALVAATIFPMQSEVVLVALLVAGDQPVWALLTGATVGNVLGSVINWALGLQVQRFQNRRWFPADATQLARAERWYRRYGRWSLLLAWAPFIGDPLTVVAGVLREPIVPFLVLVTISKLGRYLIVAGATLAWV